MPRRQPRKPDLQPPTAQEKKLTGLEKDLATAKDELRRLKAEKKAADEQNQQLLEKLERERNAGRSVKVPTKGRKRGSKRATLRVFVPDSHGASVDVGAQQAFLNDLEFLNPDEFIWIGDHLDCGGFLAQHHTLGYVPETAYTHEEDIAAANAFLDAVHEQCPKANNVYIHGNHECTHPDHEVLTGEGWRSISQVKSGDVIAQMAADGSTYWGPILKHHTYDFDGDMCEADTGFFRAMVTPNHRVVYQSDYKGGIKERTAQEHINAGPSSVVKIPRAAANKHTGVGISDDWLRLIAWIVTDGCTASDRLAIYQSKEPTTTEIRELLERLNIQYRETVRDRGNGYKPGREFHIGRNSRAEIRGLLGLNEKHTAADKHLPTWFFALNTKQASVVIETLIAADGHRRDGDKSFALYGSEEMLSQMQAFLVCNGHSATLREKQSNSGWSTGSHWCLNACPRQFRKFENQHWKMTPYKGEVYCVTTETETFLTRYRGNVHVTGNSRIEKWCIQQALGKQADAEYLMRLHSVEATLHLKQRGIREVEYGKKYDGLRVPGAIKLGRGKAIATHGSSCGVNACRDMLKKWGKSVFFGHIHRLLAYRDSDAVSTRGSWAVGLLAIPQPYYQNTKPTGHTQGYTVQLEHPDGEFMVIQVPIIDGVSYLGPLKGRLG